MLTGIGIGVPFTRRRGFSVGDLFANGEAGAWYDPSDFSTMFQDSAGTTPVTAVEQPVGLILDNSKGLVLGSELAVNGGFNTDLSGWTVSANWTWLAGRAFLNASSSSETITQVIIPAYSTVEISIDVEIVSGSLQASFAACVPALFVFSSGTNLIKVTNPTSSTRGVSIYRATNPTTAYIDNVSVKVLAGNHATQATSTARPVLRAGLDYDGVDDKHSQSAGGGSTTQFFLCAGIKPEGGAGAVRVLWSDAGTNTGYIVRLNASNQLELAAGNGTAYTTIATVATLNVGTAYIVTVWDDGTNLNVQVDSNAVASVARPVVAAGTATASIGSDNGAATGWFNGLIYSLIQVKDDAGSDAERASVKAYVAGKAGVTL